MSMNSSQYDLSKNTSHYPKFSPATGSLQGLSYPFIGGARPAYCGPPEFHISCVDDSPKLTIMSLRYRVLELNPVHKNLRLVRLDLWNSTCTDKLANTTIKSEFFTYNENEDMESVADARWDKRGRTTP
ncbi:hypothetical protein L3X38_018563 [Prunus dulcis]|uniref:Wall-associated receptor kinase galacturonan-binding domain-containing protein n=1 Tax=Prunus dulcis TaxID=3755 RepID=A0AAD4ZB50_PRUDU|nr:hypothetical protein L3X38_018563 [Prunus dulcis]